MKITDQDLSHLISTSVAFDLITSVFPIPQNVI